MSNQQDNIKEEAENKNLETNQQEIDDQELQADSNNLESDQAAIINDLTQKIEELHKKETELLLRNKADLDNLRKRTSQDIEKAHKFALEKFAKELLVVIDNLERALEVDANTTNDEQIKPLFDGVSLTLKSLIDVVNKFGIVAVGSLGETFNPELHQAIKVEKTEEYPANTIINVLQKGYLLNDRIIRPAMVIVSQS